MGTEGLDRAIQKGAPLVEITICLKSGVNYVEATERINAIADDLHLHPGDWYGRVDLRVGSATKEALERLFGWKLIRVPLEKYDEATGTWGVWEDYYRWEEVNQPTHYPPEIKDLIRSIGFSQPGGDDQGQWYE